MAVLDMFKPLYTVKKIQVDICVYSEDLTHKCKIKTVGSSKRTLEYMENDEPGHLWSNYDILNYLPELSVDNFTQIIQSDVLVVFEH